jgi:hypothetical protein
VSAAIGQGFDLADAQHEVFASLRPGAAAVVFDGETLLAAEPCDGGAPESGPVRVGGASLELELRPVAQPVVLRGENTGSEELTLARALGSLSGPSGTKEVASLALQTRVLEPSEAPLRRSIAIVFGDGGLLALAAARPRAEAVHGDEEVVAVLGEPEGEVPVSKALLSTEYDRDGRHRRATLELWPEGEGEEPPMRGAGRAICAATVEAGPLRIETAFFSWSVEGRAGLGRYDVVARA